MSPIGNLNLGKKVIILLAVFIAAALIFFQGANGNEPIPQVMIDGNIYYAFSFDSTVPTPKDEKIVGTIKYLCNERNVPSHHEETNFGECLNEPYAFVDGELIIHLKYTQTYGSTDWEIDKWIGMDKR